MSQWKLSTRGTRLVTIAWASRLTVAAMSMLAVTAVARAEACDSALYGRLCETQAPTLQKPAPTPQKKGRAPVAISPVESIGSNHMINQERPGTFGAITFQSGKQCIGLLRRSGCK
jgi:hypothetical protein